ncbi:MAG: HNH endonuclease signature motif containing protein [Candidatus Diapherotrites archaeon]
MVKIKMNYKGWLIALVVSVLGVLLLIGLFTIPFFTDKALGETTESVVQRVQVVFLVSLAMIFLPWLLCPMIFPPLHVVREPIPKSLREKILNSVRHKCELCGTSINLDLHHKNYNPADNREENLIAVCPNCHRKLDLR